MVLDALYVRKYGNTVTETAVKNMVERVRDQLHVTLSEDVKWMDRKTKQRALRKLEAISAVVGYPKELLDDAAIEQMYAGLNIEITDRFFESSIELATFKHIRMLRKLRQPLGETFDWESMAGATAVSPQFFYTENVIGSFS